MYVCTWIVCWFVCKCFHVLCHDLRVEMCGVFVLVVILNENERYNLYLFDFPMVVINISVAYGV